MSSRALLHLFAPGGESEVWGCRIRAGQRFWIRSGSRGVDRPRFGRHVLAVVVDLCISELVR
jgi:hypothetical protein